MLIFFSPENHLSSPHYPPHTHLTDTSAITKFWETPDADNGMPEIFDLENLW